MNPKIVAINFHGSAHYIVDMFFLRGRIITRAHSVTEAALPAQLSSVAACD